MPTRMRSLQQQAAQAEVTVVISPQQLLDTLEKGATNIEIRAHLDFTTVEPRDIYGRNRMLNDDEDSFSDFGNSIRVCLNNQLFLGPLVCFRQATVQTCAEDSAL